MSESPIARSQDGEESSRVRVPAVQSAIRVMSFLHEQPHPVTMTTIARALELNPSTCFNILMTLQAHDFVVREEASKAYSLGPGIAHLAQGVDTERHFRVMARQELETLAQVIGLTSAVLNICPDHRFRVNIVVDSSRPIRVTCTEGEIFPTTAPVLAKAYWAFSPPEVMGMAVPGSVLPAYTDRTIVEVDDLEAELQEVRARGFATSFGEFYPDNNAVSAPIFDSNKLVTHLILAIGFAAELGPSSAESIGRQLLRTASTLTRFQGGRVPVRADGSLPAWGKG